MLLVMAFWCSPRALIVYRIKDGSTARTEARAAVAMRKLASSGDAIAALRAEWAQAGRAAAASVSPIVIMAA